jgi:hypothetical protein
MNKTLTDLNLFTENKKLYLGAAEICAQVILTQTLRILVVTRAALVTCTSSKVVQASTLP